MNIWVRFAIVSLLSINAVSGASAGDLNPPAGPVAPTMKPLDQVEPRTPITELPIAISQPGSYYLTGNLTNTNSGTSGIVVTASNVTIDLNGFALIGGPGALQGIATGAGSGLIVRNGIVRDWGGFGVNLNFVDAIVENVLAINNGGRGIDVTDGSIVRDCVATSNRAEGIVAGQGCTISGCTSQFNGTLETHDGFRAFEGSTLINCSANRNRGAGFDLGDGCTITNCGVVQNVGCGIEGDAGNVIVNCACRFNGDDGIRVLSDSQLRGNTCFGNGDDGIQAGDRCLLVGNLCTRNDPSGNGAGIFFTGVGGRCEDNVCADNRFGLLANGSNNLIVRNAARANVSGDFVTNGNQAAPVVTNPAGNNFGTATPWSNFAY